MKMIFAWFVCGDVMSASKKVLISKFNTNQTSLDTVFVLTSSHSYNVAFTFYITAE